MTHTAPFVLDGRMLADLIGRATKLTVIDMTGVPLVARVAEAMERVVPIGAIDSPWHTERTLDAQVRVLAGLGYALTAVPTPTNEDVRLIIIDRLGAQRATLPRPWCYPLA